MPDGNRPLTEQYIGPVSRAQQGGTFSHLARAMVATVELKMMEVDLVSTRVTVNPEVRSGQPVIRGTRITVWEILGWLGGGVSEPSILNDYPELTSEDIHAALQFAYQLKDKVTQ